MSKLSNSQIDDALRSLAGWERRSEAIARIFEFASFAPAMDFVNRVAEVAEAANHHPDITINYNKVTMLLTSHDTGGVTQRDVRMAARISEVAVAATSKAA
jgi:4a-hydroxytetrahydrobiopterin dehydratase